MINYILTVLLFTEITICYYHYLSFGLHMLQLSSYTNSTFSQYLVENKRYLKAPYIYLLAFLPLSLLPQGVVGIVCQSLALIVGLWFAWVSKPLAAKKPFVVTSRVKRLYFTAFFVYFLVVSLVSFHLSGVLGLTYISTATICATVLVWLVYRIILVSNLVNRPVEALVGKHYINDAKGILAQHQGLKIMGITGSFGKTSTKYFLNTILSAKYQTLMTPASYNTTMGVVRTIREQLQPTHTHFIVEMGARGLGEIKEICDIVHPECGIITYIGEQHLETFLTIENITKTKLELADAVVGKGPIFMNIDSPTVLENLPKCGNVITYGLHDQAAYRGSQLSVGPLGISFLVTTPSGQVCSFKTKLLGAHNVVNILGAIAMSHHMGMELSEMVVPVARLVAVPHRLELKPAGDCVFIDDAFNSNPTGAKAALDALAMCRGMKILITPGMVELGTMEYELNRQFGQQAAAVCDFVFLTCRKDHIYTGLVESGYPLDKIYRTTDVKEAISKAQALQNTTDGKKYILLENDLPDNY